MKTRKKTSGLLLSLLVIFGIGFYACDKDNDDNNNNNSSNVTQQDRTFAQSATYGNKAEIEFGRVALQRSTNDSIKSYAQEMINDHTTAQNQLDSIAGKLNITLSDSLDTTHRTLLDSLSTLNNMAFDSVYINNQVKDHQSMVTLLQNQIGNGTNDSLVNYATRNLPIVNRHLLKAKDLQTNINQNGGGQ